jgi:hypothetical protein
MYGQENNTENNPYDFITDTGTAIYVTIPKNDENEKDISEEQKDGEKDYSLVEKNILTQLNGTLSERKSFIEEDFLKSAGFRRTGNVKFRKTDTAEKALSGLHGLGHALVPGIPMKPFFEIEYGALPKGQYYDFSSVLYTSKYKNYSREILIALELEYKLHIEFCNGILYSENIRYYTNENIKKFEELASLLPNSFKQLKERYLQSELPKIKKALERRENPGEDYLRAVQNLRNFGIP